MATTTVVSTIGSGQAYTTPQAHFDAGPSTYTTTRSATAQAGSTSSTIVLDASASTVSDFYKGHAVYCTARPTEKRLITAYNGSTKVATIGALNGSSATWANIPGAEAYAIDGTIWQGQIVGASTTFTSATTVLTASGQTTDANNYYELTTASGASFRDSRSGTAAFSYSGGTGAALVCTGNTAVININQAYTRISNLRIASQGTGAATAVLWQGGAGIDVNNCIIEYMSNEGMFLGSMTVRNSLIVQRPGTFGSNHDLMLLFGACNLTNCTVVGTSGDAPDTAIVRTSSFSGTVTNCVFCTPTAQPFMSGTGGTFVNCYSNGTSLPTGVSAVTYNTSLFTSITDATYDYRLPVGSALIDAGTTVTGADTDAMGTTRPQGVAYDVGAWEYPQGAPPSLSEYYLGTDITTGNWTTSTGTGTLSSMLDELPRSDTDYIQSAVNPVADTCELEFSGVQTPSADTDHTISYAIKVDGTLQMVVKLIAGDGTTVVKTWTHNPAPTTFTQYDQALTTAEADAWLAAGYPGSRLRVTAG